MKKLFVLSVIAACFVSSGFAQNSSPVKVRVLKDNTNLRAKPALNVEVAGQMSANQELTVKSMDAEWVEVVAPTNIDFWVLGDYLRDGIVVCRRMVNVRAGPGINFSVVGQMTNNVKVDVRGSHADWVKIAPPESCSLWVSRFLVTLRPPTPVLPVRVAPAKPPTVESPAVRPSVMETSADRTVQAEAKKPEDTNAIKPAGEAAVFPVTKRGAEQAGEEKKATVMKPPADLDLIPEVGQGQWKQFEGVLRPKNFLVRSPSGFRLVADNKDGQPRTVCFVKGNRAQLDALLFRELIISGRQYWVHRQRYPVLVPDKIILK
ncbi:MAG: SH3 domain-containing protein [Kiritimatiellia bacterium]|nr:SH3 domain-containing protein [Kiritimatiellia bacterium]